MEITQVKKIDHVLRHVHLCDRITVPELYEQLAAEGIYIDVSNIRNYLKKLEENGKVKSELGLIQPKPHQQGSFSRRFYSPVK